MHNTTRAVFDQYAARVAQLSGVDSASSTFNVAPSVQQTLETKIQESSEFLGKINIIGVAELEGQKVQLGISGPVASRTDTTKGERKTRDLSTLDPGTYRCEKTDFDTHLPYAKLDAWAKFKDFQTRIRNAITQRQALDRMMIGFHGRLVAANSDPAKNPMLEDVNIGWLQQWRNHAPQRVLHAGENKTAVRIGADGDYANLDAAVFDAVTLIDPWYRTDPGLVVILGRELMHDKYFPLINTNHKPTDTLAADIVVSQKRAGGLPAVTVPYFPERALLITRLDNLSIYWQEGARRRRMVDRPERDRIENYESSNDAYVVEDYGLGAIVENIELLETPAEQPAPAA